MQLGVEELNIWVLDGEGGNWLSDDSLGWNSLTLLVGFGFNSVVLSDSVKEFLSAGWKSEMFHSDVKSLGDDSVSDLFVNNDSQSSWVDIEDCTSSAVVVLVWHRFVDGTINNDIDDISDFVGGEVFRHSDGSVASESLLEFVSGSSLISVAVSHGCD